jgi:hypothetical protein
VVEIAVERISSGAPAVLTKQMLIDSFAPNPDEVEVHSIAIEASPTAVHRAIWTADLGGSSIIKLLLGMRALPELVLHGGRKLPRDLKVTLRTIINSGFGVLADEPQEIVLGVNGKFWRPTGNLLPFDRDSFAAAIPSGQARGIWNFAVKPNGSGTILSTETRVTCGDPVSLRRFRVYWFFVRPFSGLIRIIMLRAVKRACGKTNGQQPP